MAVFSTRSGLYQCAVGLLVISLVLATWGVIAPGWIEVSVEGVKRYYGLRWDCKDSLSNCTLRDLTQASDLQKATIGLSYIGLFFLGVSTLAVVFRELCAPEDSKHKHSYGGMLIIGSGVILFTGCMVFVNEDFKTTTIGHAADFGPSFIMTLVASLTSSLSGLVVVCYTTISYWQRRRPQVTQRVLSPYPHLSTEGSPGASPAMAGHPEGNIYHSVSPPSVSGPLKVEGSRPYGQPAGYPGLPVKGGDPYSGSGTRGFRNVAYARELAGGAALPYDVRGRIHVPLPGPLRYGSQARRF